jgi:CheY-like chemotaxis protein
MSILIVEDNPINAMVLENFLAKGGYQTAVAKNARDALASVPQLKDLQLIITDLSMPDMDGLELIAHLRGTSATKTLPVIIVTGNASATAVERAKGLECAAFLVKPIDKVQLLKRVESLLNESPSVLQDQQRMMNIMGIGTPEYTELMKAFRAQVRIALSTVGVEQGESDEAISENASQRFRELAESARILGADQYATLYARLKGITSLTRRDCIELRKVLQELESVLTKNSPLFKPEALR